MTNIFIPVIILTYCYTRMFRAIRAHSKRLQQNSTLEQDIILAQQKKVTITLFIVLAVFIICALPYHLYATYTTIQKDKHFSPYLNPMVSGWVHGGDVFEESDVSGWVHGGDVFKESDVSGLVHGGDVFKESDVSEWVHDGDVFKESDVFTGFCCCD